VGFLLSIIQRQLSYKIIKKGHFTFPDPYWTDISPSAKDLVTNLLRVDPRERFTAEQVLAHEWVKGSTARAEAFPASHTLRLKLLQAKRKLKRTVRSIMAINKFSHALDQYVVPAGKAKK